MKQIQFSNGLNKAFLVTSTCLAVTAISGAVNKAQAQTAHQLPASGGGETVNTETGFFWGGSGSGAATGSSSPIDSVSEGDSVDINGRQLYIGDGASAGYVDGVPTAAIGITAITDTAGGGDVDINTGFQNEQPVIITIGSVSLSQTGGNLSLNSRGTVADGERDFVDVTITGDLTADVVTVEVTSTDARETADLTVGGNITANSIEITEGSTGTNTATLTLNGGSEQTVTANITGSGDIVIAKSGGSAIMTGTVNTTGDFTASSAVDFQGASNSLAAVTLQNGASLDVSGTTTSIGSLTLENGALAIVDAGTTITGAITNNGTLRTTGGSTVTLNNAFTGASGAIDIDASTDINGDIEASAVTISAGQDLSIGVDANSTYAVATTTLEGADAQLNVTAGAAVTGNIVASSDGAGGIAIADGTDATEFTGNIGTSSASLATLDIAGGAANVVSLTGDLYADAITMDNADTLQFLGTSAQTISGTVTGGNIDIGNGTDQTITAFQQEISAVLGTVNANSRMALFDNATFSGTFTNNGRVVMASNTTLSAAQFAGSGVYSLTLNDATISKLIDTDSASASSFDIVNIQLDITSAPSQTTSYDNVITGGQLAQDGTLSQGNITATDGVEYEVTLANDQDGNIDLTIVIEEDTSNDDSSGDDSSNSDDSSDDSSSGDSTDTQTQIAEVTGSSTAFAALSDAQSSGSNSGSERTTAINNINNATSAQEAQDLIQTTTSDVSGGSVAASVTVANQTTQITSQRLASLRSGDSNHGTGIAAGDGFAQSFMNGLKAWGQVFGIAASQDDRNDQPGYDATTAGFAIGADTKAFDDKATLGLSLSYADTDVEGDLGADTDVTTLGIAAYADYQLDPRTYIAAQIGYAMSDNDTTRSNISGTGNTATASFDATQYLARLELGRRFDRPQDGITLTPKTYLNYMHYNADNYTETGAGDLNLSVSTQSLNLLELGIALDIESTHQYANGDFLKPKFTLGARHDFIGDRFEASNTFQGASNSFIVTGYDPAQTTFNVGLGVTYVSTQNWDLVASYDYQFKSDFAAHTGLLKWIYKF